MKVFGKVFAWMVLFCLIQEAQAARIGDITDLAWEERVLRFFSLQDASVRFALCGSVLLGICCGLMGSFLVVRRLALMGDALSHAVLPGVALGFLWNLTKDPVAIFIGATAAGLLGAVTVQLIVNTTRHKEDAALGFVLATFYSVGICLFTMLQNVAGAKMGGLEKFMFGQAATLGAGDVQLLAFVTLLTVCAVAVFYKEFLLTSFDTGFAQSLGMPVRVLNFSLILLLAFAIVASLQAVGVVLVSALLVIPAATAHLLTERFGLMIVLSAIFGLCAGVIGTFLSFVGHNLPTGPFMVLAAATGFAAALFFAPRSGIFSRLWQQRALSARIRRENMLKEMFHLLERDEFRREYVGLAELAAFRHQTIEDTKRQLEELRRGGFVNCRGDAVSFTPPGWQRGCEIVRNHRLWELYLTNAAQIAADHVHDDAEKIEHVLGEETVLRLEKRLNYARRDPHGKLIPLAQDMHSGRSQYSTQKANGPDEQQRK